MGWPVTFGESVALAEKYRQFRQWRDAGAEYVRAATLAPDQEWTEICLLEAFTMQDRAIEQERKELNDRR